MDELRKLLSISLNEELYQMTAGGPRNKEEDSRIKIESDVNMSEAGVYTVTYRLNSDVTRLIVVVEE